MSAETTKKKMTYVRLGQSGLKVSRIILGLMSYGSAEWQPWILGEKEGIEHIKAAYEAGIQTFDTANVYSNGESERILGKAIKELKLPRDGIVVMTKLYATVGRTPGERYPSSSAAVEAGYVNQQGLSRKHIFESIKHSLERLQLDYVDVLQCHRFDPDTPIAETMQALHDVVQAGYVRYIGMSSCHAYQFHAMQNYAINNKLTPFISMQNHHNLLYREEEREMIPTLQMFGVGMIPWSPLARGTLTRPLKSEATARSGTDPWANYLPTTREANATIVGRVEEIAKSRNISMAQVAIAWSLSKEYMTAPIIGTTNLKNLEDIIGSLDVKLTEEEIKKLEEPYAPQPIVGHYLKDNGSNSLDEKDYGDNLDDCDEYERTYEDSERCKQPKYLQGQRSIGSAHVVYSFHSGAPVSTSCPLDLSLHMGTTPLLNHHLDGSSTPRDMELCFNRPHSENVDAYFSICVCLILGIYLGIALKWRSLSNRECKKTVDPTYDLKSPIYMVSEAFELEVKVPPKRGQLVYLSGFPIPTGEEVRLRTLEEYGSIVDEEPVDVRVAVRQDINVLFRGSLSSRLPSGVIHRPNRTSSAPAAIMGNSASLDIHDGLNLRVTPATHPSQRSIPVLAPPTLDRGRRPSPLIVGYVAYSGQESHTRTPHPCFASSPLRQSTVPSPSSSPLSPTWVVLK
ncbi:aldo/keto reductase family protein [Ceratobasidium sp. AG-Ba]|nr:aldo/keto reductase family protein [Ceratobasidium sp. AG-Ba]